MTYGNRAIREGLVRLISWESGYSLQLNHVMSDTCPKADDPTRADDSLLETECIGHCIILIKAGIFVRCNAVLSGLTKLISS